MRMLLALSFVFVSFTALAAVTQATVTPEKDREAIKKFAGCFEVTFDFAETFPLVPGYKIAEPYHQSALEYVTVDEETSDRISLQHVLVFRSGVQKHWRQEWIYEGDWMFQFQGFSTWEKVVLPTSEVAGRWIQRVYQVDDGPRYECAAPWVHWGSESYWECSTARPLPRRDFTKRSDYHVINARNRQQLTPDGWVHEEDNTKVILANGKRTPLVKEKGENHYYRVADSRCVKGAEYWNSNRTTWHAIVDAWDEVYASQTTLKLNALEGKPQLYEALFDLAERANRSRVGAKEITKEAKALITSYTK